MRIKGARTKSISEKTLPYVGKIYTTVAKGKAGAVTVQRQKPDGRECSILPIERGRGLGDEGVSS